MFSSNICHCNYYVSLIRLKVKSEVAQLCPTLCDPMDCSPPGSSIHGIFQERVLEWGAISFSRGSSQPRDWTQVSRTAGRRFTVWATREALDLNYLFRNTEVLGAFQWLLGGGSHYMLIILILNNMKTTGITARAHWNVFFSQVMKRLLSW